MGARRLRPVITEHTYPIMGYHFEIDEVIRCLENGVLESDLMPLQYTREVLEVVKRHLTELKAEVL